MRLQRSLLFVCTASLGTLLGNAANAAPPLSNSKVAQSPPMSATATSDVPVRESIGPEQHAKRLAEATAALSSSDVSDIQLALANLKELQGRAAADAVLARLKGGLPPQLTMQAIEALSALEQPVAAPVLSELALHRRWQIRERAVSALAALKMRSSVSVLLYALDDPSEEVRSAAARALGSVGDARARHALHSAVARGVPGALEGLAQLASAADVEVILTRARADLPASEPALWILLSRPTLPPASKHKVIALVYAHEAKEQSAQLLASWRERLKASGDVRLLAALNQPAAAARTADQDKAKLAAATPVAKAEVAK